MKKKVIWAFSLVLWALIACTLLSLRIEQLMVPKVVVTSPDPEDNTLPLECLVTDEYGIHLYTVWEGTGWEKGMRANEAYSGGYVIGLEAIEEVTGGKFILHASKALRPGDIVDIQKNNEKQDDTWLVVFDSEAEPMLKEFPDSITVLGEQDDLMLLSVEQVLQPFMPDRAQSMVTETIVGMEQTDRYYSLLELGRFVGELPKLALLVVLLLVPVLLWLYSFVLTKDAQRNKKHLVTNAGITAAALIGMIFLLKAIDLPSSLLPKTSILDFAHYSAEFTQAFAALSRFTDVAAVQSLLSATDAARMTSILIVCASVLFAVIVAVIESILIHRRNAFKGKHLRKK